MSTMENDAVKAQADLIEALGIEREDNERRASERKLLLHDPDINKIVQRRLERGEWLLGPKGYVRARFPIAKQEKG